MAKGGGCRVALEGLLEETARPPAPHVLRRPCFLLSRLLLGGLTFNGGTPLGKLFIGGGGGDGGSV